MCGAMHASQILFGSIALTASLLCTNARADNAPVGSVADLYPATHHVEYGTNTIGGVSMALGGVLFAVGLPLIAYGVTTSRPARAALGVSPNGFVFRGTF